MLLPLSELCFVFLRLMGDGRKSKDLLVSTLPCSSVPVCLIGRNLSFCFPPSFASHLCQLSTLHLKSLAAVRTLLSVTP